MRNIDFNKYQSALIIGNGFDLSLGLSTSYMDFVNSDEFQILLWKIQCKLPPKTKRFCPLVLK